ncbi:hypothetical protein F5B20DRAFT_554780 [Whalleya microplaca]|nr:hypothetical protein F5B20DRAFT_554780 [Whalleya microplaca]
MMADSETTPLEYYVCLWIMFSIFFSAFYLPQPFVLGILLTEKYTMERLGSHRQGWNDTRSCVALLLAVFGLSTFWIITICIFLIPGVIFDVLHSLIVTCDAHGLGRYHPREHSCFIELLERLLYDHESPLLQGSVSQPTEKI